MIIIKILGVIPARGNSKGLPGKNIKKLNGKPLIAWSIEEAKKSEYLNDIIVSTESDEITNISKSYGAKVYKRPVFLSQDTTPTADVIINLFEELKKENNLPDILVLLQCTSPLRKSFHIDQAIKMFLQNLSNCDSLISVAAQREHIYLSRTITDNGKLKKVYNNDKNLTRRQDYEEMYTLNGAIYIIKTKTFLEYKKFETENTLAYIMEKYYSIDIDTQMDFDIAEFLMVQNTNNNT